MPTFNMTALKENLVAVATIAGTVVACVAIGYAVGKDTNDGLVNFLREKNQMTEKTENELRAELTAVKLELQSSRLRPSTWSGSVELDPASATGTLSAKNTTDGANLNRIALKTGETASLFDGKLLLSVVGISYQGSPLRHVVTATLGAPGKPSKTIDAVDVGFVVNHEGFEVRLIASDTFTGTFIVTKPKA